MSVENAELRARITGDGDPFKAAVRQVIAALGELKGETAEVGNEAQTAARKQSRAFRQLKREIDPVYAQTQKYNRAVHIINQQQQRGLLTDAEKSRMLSQLAQRYHLAAGAADNMNEQIRASRFASANMMAQFQDIGVMMASGQSPFLLAVQQGSQLNQIMLGLGDRKQIFATLTAAAKQFLNPLTFITFAVIAGVAALGQFAMRALSSRDASDAASASLLDYAENADVAREEIARLNAEQEALNRGLRDTTEVALARGIDEQLALIAEITEELETAERRRARELRGQLERAEEELAQRRELLENLRTEREEQERREASQRRLNDLIDRRNALLAAGQAAVRERNKNEMQVLGNLESQLEMAQLIQRYGEESREVAAARARAEALNAQLIGDAVDEYVDLQMQIQETQAEIARAEEAAERLQEAIERGTSVEGSTAPIISQIIAEMEEAESRVQFFTDSLNVSTGSADELVAAVARLEEADGAEAQAMAARDLATAFVDSVGGINGMTEAQLTFLEALLNTEAVAARISEIEKARAEQFGARQEELQNEIELLNTILEYGQDSIEVEQLRAAQLRAEYEARLIIAGITGEQLKQLMAMYDAQVKLTAQVQEQARVSTEGERELATLISRRNSLLERGQEAARERQQTERDVLYEMRQQVRLAELITDRGEDSLEVARERARLEALSSGLVGEAVEEYVELAMQIREAEEEARRNEETIRRISEMDIGVTAQINMLASALSISAREAAVLLARLGQIRGVASSGIVEFEEGDPRRGTTPEDYIDPANTFDYPESGGVGGGSAGGGGTSPRDEAQEALDRLEEQLMSETELELQAYEERQAILQEALERKLLTQQEYQERMEEIARQHAERMAELDIWQHGTRLQQAERFFGDMASAFATGNEEMLRISKAFGAAEALINAWRTFSQVMADESLPWFAKIPAAVALFGQAIKAVDAIKGVGKGGSGPRGAGSGGGGGPANAGSVAAQESRPQLQRTVTIIGDRFNRRQAIELAEFMNEGTDDGLVIRGRR